MARPPSDAMTRDDVLFWLNDRIGKEVNVSVKVERGGFAADLVTAEGVLRHWSGGGGLAWSSSQRADLEGSYEVGGEAVSLDLSKIVAVDAESSRSQLIIELSHDVWLSVLDLDAAVKEED